MRRRALGWALESPGSKIIPATFSTNKDECWTRAFAFLLNKHEWMAPYWKDWEGSIKAAADRGYTIERVEIRAYIK